MKENLINEGENYIENLSSLSYDDLDAFYFSQWEKIPNKIKDDFKKYQNFLLIFVNPKSGSQQGKTVLEHIKKYKESSIASFNVISFPLNTDDSLIKIPKELNSKKDISFMMDISNKIFREKSYCFYVVPFIFD